MASQHHYYYLRAEPVVPSPADTVEAAAAVATVEEEEEEEVDLSQAGASVASSGNSSLVDATPSLLEVPLQSAAVSSEALATEVCAAAVADVCLQTSLCASSSPNTQPESTAALHVSIYLCVNRGLGSFQIVAKYYWL